MLAEMKPILVITTTDNQADAQRIARVLVEKKLAACVQIVGPIESVYRWQGQIETSQEWQCQAKTIDEKYDEIEAAIIALHGYEVPEIVVVAITGGSDGYLRWIAEEVQSHKTP